MTAARVPEQAPERLRTGGAPLTVGRDNEIAALRDVLVDGPALAVVEGEPGIGKTRLVRAAVAGVGDVSDRTGLVVSFPPVSRPAPLGAVVAAVQRAGPDVASLGLSGLAGALRPILPEWSDDLPPAPAQLGDPAAVRHRLFRAVTELVEALGVDWLVLEDVQWADAASLEWLLLLHAQQSWGDRSVVVTYRPWELPDDSMVPRLVARTPASMRRLRLRLEPLDADQVRAMVSSIYDRQQVSVAFAEFLCRATDGVPLAVEEYLLLLEDRRDIHLEDGQWSRRALSELAVPAGVRESVLERFHRLDEATQRLLQAASVDPEPGTEALLVGIADLEPEIGRVALATALGCGLLQESSPGSYAFRHALDAQAVAEDLPASERRRLHAGAARELAASGHGPAVRLAHHLREAGAVREWAVAAQDAARIALESGDGRVAVETLLEVLTVDLPAQRQVKVACRLAVAAFFGGQGIGDLAEQVVQALQTVLDDAGGSSADRGELRLHLGRMLWERGQWEDAFVQWETAVDDLDEQPALAVRAMANMAMPLVPAWPVQRHRRWLDRAGAIIEETGDDVVAGDRMAYSNIHVSALLLMGDDAGWEELQGLPSTGGDVLEERSLVSARSNAALALLAWGRYDRAGVLLERVGRRLEQGDFDRLRHIVTVAEGRRAWYTGEWDGLAARMQEVVNSPEPDSSTQLHAQQLHALVKLATGAHASARAELQACVARQERLGLVSPGVAVVPAALARLNLSVGDASAACAVLSPLVEVIVHKQLWFWLADLADVYVTALLEAGRPDAAHSFFAGLAGDGVARDMPAAQAAVLTCQAVLTAADASGSSAQQRAAAEAHDVAAVRWAALPRPYDELLCRERAAQLRMEANGTDNELAELVGIHGRFRKLGATWDADRVARALRERGLVVPRTWHGGQRGYGDELSPRETEVVQLVTQGHTNQQVADALFISRRTVEGHVSSAMRKLDVSSRTALAVATIESGITLRDPDRHVPQVR